MPQLQRIGDDTLTGSTEEAPEGAIFPLDIRTIAAAGFGVEIAFWRAMGGSTGRLWTVGSLGLPFAITIYEDSRRRFGDGPPGRTH